MDFRGKLFQNSFMMKHRISLICGTLLAGVCFGQQPPKPDTATLELARSIYARTFTELREAKTMDDMRKLSDRLDSQDWIFVDRFGRTGLTKKDAERDLESMLSLPPERRVAEMDIIWAEQDADRLMVLAWMAPHETETGDKHRVMVGIPIRDLFAKTPNGWIRFRHEKLTPNSTVLAVDGKQRIMPPMDDENRVTPLK
jgi:hypothetical protein